jgi:hypothetical protein
MGVSFVGTQISSQHPREVPFESISHHKIDLGHGFQARWEYLCLTTRHEQQRIRVFPAQFSNELTILTICGGRHRTGIHNEDRWGLTALRRAKTLFYQASEDSGGIILIDLAS